MFVNCFLFFLLSSKIFRPESRHIKFVLFFHIFFFVFQFLYYYILGDVINYHTFTDIDPRLESSIFRPAGLFYEPAIYCLNIFMLLILLNPAESKFSVIEALAIISMVLSVSLLGFALAFMSIARLIRFGRYAILIYTLLLMPFAGLIIAEGVTEFVGNRVLDLGADASAGDRYGGLFTIFSQQELVYYFFGKGFGADFEKFGGSGIAAAISSVGIIGVVFFIVWLLCSVKDLFSGVLFLIAILISAPVFSYGIFPYWIANLVEPRKRSMRAEARPDTSAA
jgi:hypothetical protein